MGTLGGVIILIIVLVSVFADLLAPYHYDEQDVVIRLQGFSAEHLLGTDHVGRDFLSRNIYGARISLLVGLAATSVDVIVAILVGALSDYIGGRLDLTVQRFVDAWMAFPVLLLLLTIMSIVGQGVLQIIVVLGVTGGIANSRVIRGAVIGVKENVYFEAAKALGCSQWRILIRHVWHALQEKPTDHAMQISSYMKESFSRRSCKNHRIFCCVKVDFSDMQSILPGRFMCDAINLLCFTNPSSRLFTFAPC